MALANGTSVMYLPIAGSAGSSLWGSDVRKLLASADATEDSSTVCNLGTGGTVTRTCDPYSTSTADLAQADYGWAITPSDMGSVSGAKRVMPAGNHVATVRTNPSAAFTVEQRDITMFAYRIGPSPSRTRTLLGSATAQMGLVVGETSITIALPELVFDNDETIQYSFEMVAGGLIITGRTVTFNTGTYSSGILGRVDFPGLKTIADTVGSATGLGSASGVGAARFSGVGAASGSVSVAGIGASFGAGVGASAGSVSVSGVGASRAATVGSSAGTGDATGIGTGIFSGVGNASGQGAGTGVGASRFAGLAQADGNSIIVGVGNSIFSGVGNAAGQATADGLGSSVAGGIGNADGTATVVGRTSRVLGTVGTVTVSEGGGTTTKKIYIPFGDDG